MVAQYAQVVGQRWGVALAVCGVQERCDEHWGWRASAIPRRVRGSVDGSSTHGIRLLRGRTLLGATILYQRGSAYPALCGKAWLDVPLNGRGALGLLYLSQNRPYTYRLLFAIEP